MANLGISTHILLMCFIRLSQ